MHNMSVKRTAHEETTFFLCNHLFLCNPAIGHFVLRPATSTQVFLGFPLSISIYCDGFQDSKLPLHASHVVLPA